MNLKSLNFIKVIISLFVLIIGIYFIIKGGLVLNKNNHNIESQINFSDIEISDQEKNNQSKNKVSLIKKNLIIKENLKEKIVIVKKNSFIICS